MNSTDSAPAAEAADAAPATFDDLPLRDEVARAIAAVGWTEPTPVQIQAYGPSVEGKDLIVQSRTGTGKTAAFGIPLVDRIVRPEPGVQALILAPTRELALQSAREIERIATNDELTTVAIYGGAAMDPQVRALADGAQIVSGTPGRVLDHLKRGTLDASGLRVLVLDEADEMLSMGFAKELHAIMERLPEPRQTLLYSATVDGPVQRVAERHMTDPTFVTLSGDAVGALGVSHFVYMVTGLARERDLARVLEIEDPESAIVFCNTKAETEQVAAALNGAGFDADWLNGDLPQGEREKVMARTRQGKLRYLVATDVAARGIDVSHLTHVINYGMPQAVEQYIHRTGRTGRAGRTGTAISLVAPQELGSLYYLRLTYKIFPVERTLPSAREERTRREADRVKLLEAAFTARAEDVDLAVARRLLTHPRAEQLLAGLLGTFFSPIESPDELAAAGRRERRPEAVSEAKAPKRSKRREPKPTRPMRAKRGDSEGPAEPDAEADVRNEDSKARTSSRRKSAAPDEGQARIWINVGRKDGVGREDLRELLTGQGALGADQVGRVRVRDKHSFVDVPEEGVDELVSRLSGHSFHDRELAVEPARGS